MRGAGWRRSETPSPTAWGRVSHVIAVPAHDGGHMTGQWAGCDHMTCRWRPALFDVPGQPLRPGPARLAPPRWPAPPSPSPRCFSFFSACSWGTAVRPSRPWTSPSSRICAGGRQGRGVGRGSNPQCLAFVRRRSAAFGTASAGMGGSVSAPRKELRPGAVAGAGLRCVALPWETCPCPLRRASPPSRVLAGGTAAYQ